MRRGALKFIILVAFIAAAFVAARELDLGRYMRPGELSAVVDSFGAWAPAIYILLYALSACLMFPGLPVTFAGGIIFGPLWGVVYVAIGATLGASLAFLIARYMGRDWVESMLHRGRLKELYDRTEAEGWKIVAVARLIPIFPYNFLNYAFGLTRVRFGPYVAASFIFMLPGIVAYVVFSSSILDLLEGRFSAAFFIGLALIVIVSLIPFVFRWLKRGV